jgi:hypothetical protein
MRYSDGHEQWVDKGRQKDFVVSFKSLLQNSPEEADENHEALESLKLVI